MNFLFSPVAQLVEIQIPISAWAAALLWDFLYSIWPFFVAFLGLYLLVYWRGKEERRALCMYGLFFAAFFFVVEVALPAYLPVCSLDLGLSVFTHAALPLWGMFALSALSLLRSKADKRYAACWLAASTLYLLTATYLTNYLIEMYECSYEVLLRQSAS